MGSVERKIDSVGLAGARKIASQKLGSISNVKIQNSNSNSIAFATRNSASTTSTNVSVANNGKAKSTISKK